MSRVLFVTTGDPDGIGPIVAAKAILQVQLPRTTKVCLLRTTAPPSRVWKAMAQKTRAIEVKISSALTPNSLNATLENFRTSKSQVIDLILPSSPPCWISPVAQLCMQAPHSYALVTGPLSKTLIKQSGWPEIGHTELLAKASGASPLFMSFIGKKFSVVLATGHVPLKDVASHLTAKHLLSCLQLALNYVKRTGSTKPIALVGLNPHAGEQGLLGREEIDVLQNTLKTLGKEKGRIQGPLVPDVAFQPGNWRKYALYVALYHDQGLIPFKLVHGFQSGVHLTLGLPFVRTSVDHGTAKDLPHPERRAHAGSMIQAIKLADQLLRERT